MPSISPFLTDLPECSPPHLIPLLIESSSVLDVKAPCQMMILEGTASTPALHQDTLKKKSLKRKESQEMVAIHKMKYSH